MGGYSTSCMISATIPYRYHLYISTSLILYIQFVHIIGGLKQQLSKIDNSSLNTTHSARNLGFIFDEHLTFSDQISSLSSPASLMSVNSAVSVLTLILKQPLPSLPCLRSRKTKRN